MIVQRAQRDFAVFAAHALGCHEKDAKAGTTDIVQPGKVDNELLDEMVVDLGVQEL